MPDLSRIPVCIDEGTSRVDPPLQPAISHPTRKRPGLSDRGVANMFLLPTVILLIAMNVFPLFWSLYLSFCKYEDTGSTPASWIGGGNYTRLLSDPSIWKNFTTTAQFSVKKQFLIINVLMIVFGLTLSSLTMIVLRKIERSQDRIKAALNGIGK